VVYGLNPKRVENCTVLGLGFGSIIQIWCGVFVFGVGGGLNMYYNTD
jgi:hypothetical protein